MILYLVPAGFSPHFGPGQSLIFMRMDAPWRMRDCSENYFGQGGLKPAGTG